jgi:hypothetical protein
VHASTITTLWVASEEYTNSAKNQY